jgi:hypothetical protein
MPADEKKKFALNNFGQSLPALCKYQQPGPGAIDAIRRFPRQNTGFAVGTGFAKSRWLWFGWGTAVEAGPVGPALKLQLRSQKPWRNTTHAPIGFA